MAQRMNHMYANYRHHQQRDPKSFWGPHYWFVLHSAAASFDPKKEGAKEGFLELINSYTKILPCDYCRQHLKANLKTLPPNEYFASPDQLFLWTYHLHDLVNRQLNKKSVSFPQAKKYYFEGAGLECKGCQV